MRLKRVFYYIFILFGAAIVIYTQNDGNEHLYLLIIGFCLLMAGLFGVYSLIKTPKPDIDPFAVQNEEEE
ncbi:MAG: hypothetical protein KJO49_01335 [Bacteroidia bacterium]|nr:hypothetical protein [Bacteroidia bacterium]MBT8269094.1 hypothetical protein [Bacteroidia bacterium]NNF82436.1 hypothetical protein [Flavobacteriaceae bacterium]NNK55057.1 hypothetical protein [Flavobacteriaceae bacterium]NNL80190.1 hypothetical protein [Flavobacteriaceae bacterium]